MAARQLKCRPWTARVCARVRAMRFYFDSHQRVGRAERRVLMERIVMVTFLNEYAQVSLVRLPAVGCIHFRKCSGKSEHKHTSNLKFSLFHSRG